jgi:hypothetical protein
VRAALAVLLLSACVVPPLAVSGKPCSGTCPDGWSCQGRLCIPDGGRFCDWAPSGATSCLDFEQGLPLDGGWQLEVINGAGVRVENGALVSETLDGGSAMPGRLRFLLPAWQHVRLSFDFRPVSLNADDGFVAISEIQCEQAFDGAWFHYVSEQTGPVLVLRTGPNSQPSTTLMPQPEFGAWTRVTLETTDAGASGTATLSLDGAQAGTTPFLNCTNPWEANLGLSVQTGSAAQQAQFDNVVLEVTPP